MSDPIIADNKPVPVQLTASEEKFWCACGQSNDQPFCDGSHVGTEFSPLSFTADADGEAYLCVCKRTGTPPYCDGTHAQFADEMVGTDGNTTTENPTETPVGVSETGKAPEPRATPDEPTVAFIHELARDGLTKLGHHGPMTSMGVPRRDFPIGMICKSWLPKWQPSLCLTMYRLEPTSLLAPKRRNLFDSISRCLFPT